MGEKDKYFFKYLLQKTSVFFIRVWIKFCESKAIRKVDTMQQSCIGYATEFHGGMQQSCNNKLINNLEYKLDKKIG